MDKYKALNNVKVDIDKYKEIKTNDELMILKVKEKLNNQKKPNKHLKIVATIVASIIMGGTSIYAAYYLNNRINVNNQTLPELDPMHVVEINSIDGTICENTGFFVDKEYSSYEELSNDLGVELLDSNLATKTPYLQGHVVTSTEKSLCKITLENYIVGDTSNFTLVEDINAYNSDPGEEYYSPVDLHIDIIPREEELINGADMDYLGMYEFQESYVSSKGYKVNIVSDTTVDESTTGIVSEKIAIFVVNGIRYTLQGRVSIDLLKEIVDSMN